MEASQQDAQAAVLALRKVSVLAGLSDAAIEELALHCSVQSFPAETVLFHEGDRHSQIYFLCSGTVRLEMSSARGGPQPVLSVGSGDLLAWSSLVGDGIMTATAIAVEPTTAIAFAAHQLAELLDAQKELGYVVMRSVAQALSRRLLATRLQLLDLYRP